MACHVPDTSSMSPGSSSVIRGPRSALRRRTDSTVNPFHAAMPGKTGLPSQSERGGTTISATPDSRLMRSSRADVCNLGHRHLVRPGEGRHRDLFASDDQVSPAARRWSSPRTRPDSACVATPVKSVSASSASAVVSSPAVVASVVRRQSR